MILLCRVSGRHLYIDGRSRQMTGEIEVVPDEAGECLVAKVGLNEMALIRAAAGLQIIVVAGAPLALSLRWQSGYA